jgi:H+/gluconate symporter-like permease
MKFKLLIVFIPIWLWATIQTAICYPHTDSIQLLNTQIDFVWYKVPLWQNILAAILCLFLMISLAYYYDKRSERFD